MRPKGQYMYSTLFDLVPSIAIICIKLGLPKAGLTLPSTSIQLCWAVFETAPIYRYQVKKAFPGPSSLRSSFYFQIVPVR
jgi:hypothetical protein